MKPPLAHSLDDIRLFFLVSEAGGISAAHRQYGISKAQLSRAVTRLEEQCGVPLFQRMRSGLEPSPSGASLLEVARQLTELGSTAEELMRAASSTPSGPLRIAASASTAQLVVGPVLAELRRQHPDVQPSVVVSALAPDPEATNLDVVLRLGLPDNPHLVARRIVSSKLRLYTSPVNVPPDRSLSAEEVDKLGRVVIDVPGAPEPWQLTDPEGNQVVLSSPPIAVVGDPTVALSMVVAGEGVVLLTEAISWFPGYDPAVVGVLEEMTAGELDLFACFPPLRTAVPAVRVFLDLLVTYAQSVIDHRRP